MAWRNFASATISAGSSSAWGTSRPPRLASSFLHLEPLHEYTQFSVQQIWCASGDTVLDPFMGTGTTTVAAAKWGRNSIGFEIDRHYYKLAQKRISEETSSLFSKALIHSACVD